MNSAVQKSPDFYTAAEQFCELRYSSVVLAAGWNSPNYYTQSIWCFSRVHQVTHAAQVTFRAVWAGKTWINSIHVSAS